MYLIKDLNPEDIKSSPKLKRKTQITQMKGDYRFWQLRNETIQIINSYAKSYQYYPCRKLKYK